MLSPEKNDIDISKLFHWGDKFEIFDKYGKKITDVYIRLVGDADLNRARTFALRKSAELRKKLRTEDTDERLAFIASIFDVEEKEDLVQFLRVLNTRSFAQEANKEVRIPVPREPRSDASLEEQEAYQIAVDEHDRKRMDAISEYVYDKLDDLSKQLHNKSEDQLRRQYEKEMINELCEREMIAKFKDYCVFLASFKDVNFKERFFETFDDYDNVPTEIKMQYHTAYDSLEINVEELKKLLGATP